MSAKFGVAIPEKMSHLNLDSRGFPIPYIILIDDEGTPHFKINDARKVDICVKWKFCAICGKPMRDDMWMIGGPGSAFHSQGAYIDTPVHYDCGEYALKVCPYLASKNYNTYAPTDKLKNVASDHAIFVDPTLDPNRPKVFVFQKITGFKCVSGPQGQRYLVPTRPYLEIEYWNRAQKLSREEGHQIVIDSGYEIPEGILKI